MRLLSTILISIGTVIMIIATYRYYRLLKYNRKATYSEWRMGRVTETVSLVLMFVFIGGFFVGILDTILRDVEPIYTFVAAIFLLGAIFIFFSIQVQQNMAVQLRDKTMETMKAFVNAIDMKDAYTKGHSRHVYHIVSVLYDHLDEKTQRGMNKPKLLDAAMLHDIGKISIRDEILNKPGQLEEADWEEIRKHPQNGTKMLEDTCFMDIGSWVAYHHERMDGNGYYRVQAQDIPMESRIIAIADTYSALCTNRIYRKKRNHSAALDIMIEAAGTQLDSDLLQAFLRIPETKLEYLDGA